MKKRLLISLLQILPLLYVAQTAQFAFTAGTTTINAQGIYGTQGVPSTTVYPGSRSNNMMWNDNSGNLYMFGGNGYSNSASTATFNDLWKYSVSTNEWTWLTGTSAGNPLSAYGTKGVSSSTNTPGAKYGAATCTDASGNLWMFGGYGQPGVVGYGLMNDLWKYDTSTNEWTWVSGNNATNSIGVYGTKGVANATNMPGARYWAQMWSDNSGNLWVFGGNGFASTSFQGLLSDLWKFDIALGKWVWVSGYNTINNIATYGTQGVAAASNMPGARNSGACFNGPGNTLWMFGGNGLPATMSTGNLSDLWKYDISTNMWTWIKGTNLSSSVGVYGTKSVATSSVYPGGRYGSCYWTDAQNNFWLYGGYGAGAVNGNGGLNDLWQYNSSTNMWVWVSGANAIGQAPVYGTKGVASAANSPGSRHSGACAKDQDGNFWLFAGTPLLSSNYKNDLWKIVPCNAPSAPSNLSSNQIICFGASANLSASGIGNLSWYSASVGGAFLGSGASYSTPNLTTSTTYYVQDSTCTNSIRTAITVTVTQPSITITGPATVCSGSLTTLTATGATSYTWSTGVNTSSAVVSPTIASVYTVTGADALGCTSVKTKSISVLALPSISVSGSTVVCKGNATILNATGASSYTWNIGAVSPSLVTPGLSTTTVYTVTGTGSNGCRNIKTHTVNVYVVPLTLAGSYSVCQGSGTTFTASGATSYTWSSQVIGTAYGPTVTVYPNISYGYSVTAKDASNCSVTQTFVITPLSLPIVTVSIPAQQCPGVPVTVNASGASTYTWLPMNVTGTSAVITPTAMTMFTVVGTAVNTCTDDIVTNVSVKPLPSISITASQNSVCQGTSVNLYGNGSSISYVWSSGQTSYSISSSPMVTTTYTLTGTGSNGCSANAVKTVTVNPSPILTITGDSTLCSGNFGAIVASGANTYTWSNGSQTQALFINPVNTTTYAVSGKGANNCVGTATIEVTVNQLPLIQVSTTKPILCVGETATITASGANTYTWSSGGTGNEIVVTPTVSTGYTITATDVNNCSATTVYTQSVSICTGLENLSSGFRYDIYPNPSNGYITIDVDNEIDCDILNSLGEIISSVKLNEGKSVIDMSQYANGIYLIQLKANQQSKTIRLVKQ